MHTLRFRAVAFLVVCFAASSCATNEQPADSQDTRELVGRVVERSFGAVLPGRVTREPGQSAFQQRLSAGTERVALPTPTYQHRVVVGPDQAVTVSSESSSFEEGTCVLVRIPPPPKPPRILALSPCKPS
jgi:hypothetical protein